MRVDGEDASRGDAERVSVRSRLDHRRDPDIAACARPVLDHDRLMQILRKRGLQGADHDVRTAARRKRHDDPDRLIGIGLCYPGGKQRQGQYGCKTTTRTLPERPKHLSPSPNVFLEYTGASARS